MTIILSFCHKFLKMLTTAFQRVPQPNYSKQFQSLYDQKFLKLAACSEVDIHVNADMVSAVESATCDLSKSKIWFKYCAGRNITSKMKST